MEINNLKRKPQGRASCKIESLGDKHIPKRLCTCIVGADQVNVNVCMERSLK